MRTAIPVLALLLCLGGVARGDKRALDPKIAKEDIKKLEGTWNTDDKAAVKWTVWVMPFYLDGRPTGAYLIAGIKAKPELPVSEQLRPGDFLQDGMSRFIKLRRLALLDDAPMKALEYRFEKDALVFSVKEGRLKGNHVLQRVKGDRARKGRYQLLDPEAVKKDCDKLDGLWSTDAKAPVQLELNVWWNRNSVGFDLQIGGTIGLKPKATFIEPVTYLAFWQDGKRRGIMLSGWLVDDPKLKGFEYRFDGDTLVVAVPDGEAKGQYKLKRSDK
jgi:hypothetical protein